MLVIEDDPDILDVILEAISEAGYPALGARDGAEAIDKLKSTTPALIFLDLRMPSVDGVEFRTRQLQDSALAGIPTIALSALNDIEERARDLALQGAIVKPMDLDELLRVVERYCGPSRTRTGMPAGQRPGRL